MDLSSLIALIDHKGGKRGIVGPDLRGAEASGRLQGPPRPRGPRAVPKETPFADLPLRHPRRRSRHGRAVGKAVVNAKWQCETKKKPATLARARLRQRPAPHSSLLVLGGEEGREGRLGAGAAVLRGPALRQHGLVHLRAVEEDREKVDLHRTASVPGRPSRPSRGRAASPAPPAWSASP